MLLTGHQPNYLPYPGLFQKIAASEAFLVVDTTQFVKRGPFGWIHRNRIGTPDGPRWLSLPVLHRGRYEQRICDTELNPRVNWARKHWRALECSYARTPHWQRFAPGLHAIYEASWPRLAPFTTAILRWFLEQLELSRPVHVASELAATGRSTDYIIAFCQELGATGYLSGVHGRDYLDLAAFDAAGIELRFQSYTPPRYTGHGGQPAECNLSLLDMLMWCGDEAIEWVHRPQECQIP